MTQRPGRSTVTWPAVPLRPGWLDGGNLRWDPWDAGAEPGALARTVEAMIIIRADFNRLDTRGRLRLDGLAMHNETPFADIAQRSGSILFIDGEDAVQGHLVLVPDAGWLGEVDWSTQQLIESWPPATVGAH